jgi:hypothetical protein
MKRFNLREAFIGEPNPHQEGAAVQGRGHDVVELRVTGGKVTLLVPGHVPDNSPPTLDWFEHFVSWELTLENGMTMTVRLLEGAGDVDLVLQGPAEK